VFGFVGMSERDVVDDDDDDDDDVVVVVFQILLLNFANPKKHKAMNENTMRPITVKIVNTVVGL
jgi:hypothetical protein